MILYDVPGFLLVVTVAVVPAAPVRLPRSQTHPTEIGLAGLVLADHVIAATVLLYGGLALGALLRVGGDPIRRLAVVVALLDPFLDQMTPAIYIFKCTCVCVCVCV